MARLLGQAASVAVRRIGQVNQSLIKISSPVATLATMLFQHPHIGHDHAAVDCLAHVVHGQQANLHCSECFHLDAGLADGFHLRPAMHAVVGLAKKTLLVPLVGTELGQDFSCLCAVYGLTLQEATRRSFKRSPIVRFAATERHRYTANILNF